MTIADDLDVTFLPMSDIYEAVNLIDPSNKRQYREVKSGFTKFIEGDVLFAKITPCMENGKIAIAAGLKNGIGCGTTELHTFRSPHGDTSKYLYYFLVQKKFRAYAKFHFNGAVGHQRVPVSIFNEHIFPLPPLAEQKRIVAKLDAAFVHLEKIKVSLARIPELLKRFREAVLTQAVTDHKSVLVVNLGDLLADIKYGTSKKSDRQVIGTPILRIPNISGGEIESSDLKYSILDSSEYDKLKLQEGDLLIIRSNGSPSLVGQSAIVRKEHISWAYAGYLIRVRTSAKLNPLYLNHMLKSAFLRKQIDEMARSTNGINNINTEEIKRLRIPLPAIEIQQEIVTRV